MNDESAARALLERASQVPGDSLRPPLAQIAARGRRRRRRRLLIPSAAAALVTAVVIALPLILAGGGRSIPATPLLPAVTPPPTPVSTDASVAQLARDHWEELPAAPIAARSFAASVWTGSQMLIWGGQSSDGKTAYADGAAYDPSTKQWSKLPKSPLSARVPEAWAWTGDAMFVWGGLAAPDTAQRSTDGALYFPTTKTWRVLPPISVADYRWSFATWTGSKVVLLTAATYDQPDAGVVHAHAFDPATNRWSELPELTTASGHIPGQFQAVDTGGAIYLWSLWEHQTVLSTDADGVANGIETHSGIDGYTLDLRTGKWSSNKLGTPLLDGAGQPFWTGDRILMPSTPLWCGGCSPPARPTGPPGALIDPDRSTATTIALPPTGEAMATYVWTGRALLGVGGPSGSPTAAFWDPGSGSWTALAAPPGQPPGGVALWTGHELLMWGETDSDGHVAGYRLGA